jgi:hypothetical protein
MSAPSANLFCPTCKAVVGLREGDYAHWCTRCAQWLCSERCLRQHAAVCRHGLRAVRGAR